MKRLRWILPSLALAAVLSSGCILVSAQVFAHFALTNPFTINPPGTPLHVEHVDLNTIGAYNDHKSDLKGLSDIAIVGKFKNVSGPAGSVELWITPGTTNLATYDDVTTNPGHATRLWGPGSLGASPAERVIGWNESSKLFNSAGKAILIDQMLHGGVFTVYVLTTGNAGNLIEIDNGEIILVIDAGK